MSEFIVRSLQQNDLPEMHLAFQKAFSDYQVNLKLDYQTFEIRMLGKLNISFPASFGVFRGNELVAFVFHSVNDYLGITTLYNGGTGVIPSLRGTGLIKRLYDEVILFMKEKKIRRSTLEVITTNEPAIKRYATVGFERLRTLKCFKLIHPAKASQNLGYNVKVTNQPNWDEYLNIASYEPSFIDTFNQLPFNLKHEVTLEYNGRNGLQGFLIFQPHLGRISQMAVRKEDRLKGIGKKLISKAYELSKVKQLTLLNVDEGEFEMINFLTGMGFENQLDQYEMELILES